MLGFTSSLTFGHPLLTRNNEESSHRGLPVDKAQSNKGFILVPVFVCGVCCPKYKLTYAPCCRWSTAIIAISKFTCCLVPEYDVDVNYTLLMSVAYMSFTVLFYELYLMLDF